MIIVTGATGNLGRLVVEGLLQHLPASQIVAAVRTPGKANDLAALGVQVRHADYAQPQTLASAFAGREKLLLISSSETQGRSSQHAAVQAGKPVICHDLPEAEYAQALEGFGLPAPQAAMIADSDAKASQGELDSQSHDLSALIGHPTISLSAAVAQALAA